MTALTWSAVLLGIALVLRWGTRRLERHLYPECFPVSLPYVPRRVVEDPGEYWRDALAEMSPHVASTGCRALQSDFEDRDGLCPYGGTYWEHL